MSFKFIGKELSVLLRGREGLETAWLFLVSIESAAHDDLSFGFPRVDNLFFLTLGVADTGAFPEV